MEEAWVIYLEELRDRGEDIPTQEFNREGDMMEAAHEAYEASVERIHHHLDWKQKDALRITKAFNQVVKEWIDDGTMDWDELGERLEAFQQEWDQEFGRSLV